jgi:hypothetical protein
VLLPIRNNLTSVVLKRPNDPLRKRKLEIQLIGPSAGQCSSIVTGTARFLDRSQFERVVESCLNASQDPEAELKNTDVTVFLFPDPDRLSETECVEVFIPTVKAAKYHDVRNDIEKLNTILACEGGSPGHINTALEQADVSTRLFSDATLVSAEGKSELQRGIFAQCSSIEK